MSAQEERQQQTATEETPSPSSTATSATSEAEGDLNAKRKGRMSKVRGLLSGKSWREKRQAKKAKKGTEGEGDNKSGDDQSTLYGVEVDENSKAAAALAAKNNLLNGDEDHEEETDLFNENDVADKKYLLKVVLLLMDANSRRFELLQLEFDSVKASVSDVLAQIPIAVTEECLQAQSYVGITCCDGMEKSSEDVLADFCKGGDVMVAIARDMTATGCVKLALPILADPKVMAMLRASGIDSSPWKEAKKKFRDEAKREKEQQKGTPSKSASKTAPESAPSSTAAQKKGSKVESTSRSVQAADKSKAPSVITFHPNNDTPHSITARGGIHVKEVHATGGKSGLSLVTVLKGIAIFAVLAGVIKAVDMYLSAPIKLGQVLSPGTVLHKCGIAGLVPGVQSALSAISSDFDCENAYLKVEAEKVTGYDKDGKVTWIVQGTHHSNQKYCDIEDEKRCKRGLHYLDDKHLIMSGTKITWIETFQKGLTLHPWPFEEKPVTRTWKRSRRTNVM